jgi:hypothetical protein
MLIDYFKLNKNVLIAFAVSITFSAIIAQSLAEQEDYLNSFYTLIFDHLFYLSTFGGLYYLDNRKKYLLKSGKTDKEKLRHDLVKIITSLGISEIIYSISRWGIQYYFLSISYDPYLVLIISQVISSIIYMILVNLIAKMMRLNKDGN